MTYPSVSHATLPPTYVETIETLRFCARKFTPERYVAATVALERCLATDECADWPDTLETAASYVRMGSDNTLMRLAGKVERLRAAWKKGVE